MEDEAADIELLEQHLNKTSQISQKMTGILSKFDARIVKLEKSILPLYKASVSLTRISDNIDKTISTIDKVVANQETAASEEALILRGPQPGKLSTYTDVLERLNANLAFATDRMPKDAARLVETGAKKLTQLYTKLVAEGSSGTPSPIPDMTPPQLPDALMSNLTPLVAFLRCLPLPATHPSNLAAPGIQVAIMEAQKGYAEMRGQWTRRCLENHSRRMLERVETMEGVEGGREVGKWIEGFLDHAESEYTLLLALAPMPSAIKETFDNVLQPLTSLFQTTINSFTMLIKRSLSKYTFMALAAYTSLSTALQRWDDVMVRRAGRRDNELKDGLHSLRAICLRSFPEFIADIKLVSVRPSESQIVGTGVSDLTINVVKYLMQIPAVEDAVIASLSTLGDGNWKMGDGVGKTGKVGGTTVENDQVLLEHYLHDVITTLLTTLNAIAITARRPPPMATIFLLNNVSYLRNQIIDSPESSIVALLAKPTIAILNSSIRTTKAAYFDSNFSPLIQALADEKEKTSLVGGKSSMMKEKWNRFFDALEEVAEMHRVTRVLADDPDGRALLQDEVIRLVIPALTRFMQKNKDKDFSKNPQKYIKASPEEVERQIINFFR